MVKLWFVASRDALVSYVVQSKGFRVLVEALAVPECFDLASIEVVLVSSVAGAAGLAALVAAGFKGRVLCSEATAVLGQLPWWVQRVSFGQSVSVGGREEEAFVEALSSGLALGACNWRLRLWNRTVSLMGESSLWHNRHCLPCETTSLLKCDLLVVAVARTAAGGDASARVGQELRSLLSPGGAPVVVPLASLAGPVLFDVLDVVARELGQQLPSVTLIAPGAAALVAGATVLGEYFDQAHLARVHGGESPLRLVPSVVTTLSLPLSGRSNALYLTTLDLLPAVSAALGGSCSVLACDPAVVSSPLLPSSARRIPFDNGLSAAQLRSVCARSPASVSLTAQSPFPLCVRLSTAASLSCHVVSPLPPVSGSVARVVLSPGGEASLGPASPRPPQLERLVRALRRAGCSLVRVSSDESSGVVTLSLPTLNDSTIVVGPSATRVNAHSREALALVTAAMKECS